MILVLKNARFSGQIGFPGGKNEPEDKNPMHTVVRECKEELGLDLDSDDFVYLGSLDSRIVTRLDDDSKIMAVLYPYGKTMHLFIVVL